MNDIEKLAIDYANIVDDPESPTWHTRYASFKRGYVEYIDRIQELEAFKKEALELIRFYGNISAWGTDRAGHETAIDPCDQEEFFHVVGITTRGGKRARDFLKKHEVKK